MIKIAVFEDKKILRESLLNLLETEDDLNCCGGWSNCAQIEKIMDHHRPQVILMDIDMPGGNGLDGLKYIQAKYPQTQVIMLTIFDDDEHVFDSICIGAKGYLLKGTAPEKIISAIHEVHAGGSPMTAQIARRVLNAFALFKPTPETDYALTPREKDILGSLVQGNSYKLIAADLGISINTVRQYIRRIYEKLQVHSMNEAVAKAIKQRIV